MNAEYSRVTVTMNGTLFMHSLRLCQYVYYVYMRVRLRKRIYWCTFMDLRVEIVERMYYYHAFFCLMNAVVAEGWRCVRWQLFWLIHCQLISMSRSSSSSF